MSIIRNFYTHWISQIFFLHFCHWFIAAALKPLKNCNGCKMNRYELPVLHINTWAKPLFATTNAYALENLSKIGKKKIPGNFVLRPLRSTYAIVNHIVSVFSWVSNRISVQAAQLQNSSLPNVLFCFETFQSIQSTLYFSLYLRLCVMCYVLLSAVKWIFAALAEFPFALLHMPEWARI